MEKANDDYYHSKKSGYHTICKSCVLAKQKDRWDNEPGYRAKQLAIQNRAYHATKHLPEKRAAAKAQAVRNARKLKERWHNDPAFRQRSKEIQRERYKNDPAFKASRYASAQIGAKKRRKDHPEKVHAVDKLRGAVAAGRIIKPPFCSDCYQAKTARQLHGHHDDYTKPLIVRWLCAPCHSEHHRLMRTAA